jgi:hypothetical protein
MFYHPFSPSPNHRNKAEKIPSLAWSPRGERKSSLVWIGTGFAAGLVQSRARVFQPGKDKSSQEQQFFLDRNENNDIFLG